jgi:hypothetical protein
MAGIVVEQNSLHFQEGKGSKERVAMAKALSLGSTS